MRTRSNLFYQDENLLSQTQDSPRRDSRCIIGSSRDTNDVPNCDDYESLSFHDLVRPRDYRDTKNALKRKNPFRPALYTDPNAGGSIPSQPGGWEQASGATVTFTVPNNWSGGRIWGRTECNFSTNPGPTSCATGGCNGGLLCTAGARTRYSWLCMWLTAVISRAFLQRRWPSSPSV